MVNHSPAILILGRALEKGETAKDLLAGLERLGSVRVAAQTPSEVSRMRELLSDREILVFDPVPYVQLRREMLEATPIRFITVTTSGYDHLDLQGARDLEIEVSNVPQYGRKAVAEQTLALLLSLFWKIPSADRLVRSQGWDFRPFLGTEIAGKTFGIIGLGDIGSRVAEIAQAFRATVIAHDIRPRRLPGVRMVSLRELVEQSDIISLHADLNPSSLGLFGREQFGWMKPSAVLVNTGRGRLVDETALIEALQDGRIGGAALDVLTLEQPGTENPLFGLPNVVLSPHMAFCTREALARRNQIILENVQAFLAGKPIHRIVEEAVACL